MPGKIKVAITGVGNGAGSFVHGVECTEIETNDAPDRNAAL